MAHSAALTTYTNDKHRRSSHTPSEVPVLAITCALLFSFSSPAVVSAEDPERVFSQAKFSIECDLEHISREPIICQVRFLNRNEFDLRLEYQLETVNGDKSPVMTTLLRPRYSSNANGSVSRTKEQATARIVLPSGIDYKSVEILRYVSGTIIERFGTRVSSNGTSEQYSELEFTEDNCHDSRTIKVR